MLLRLFTYIGLIFIALLYIIWSVKAFIDLQELIRIKSGRRWEALEKELSWLSSWIFLHGGLIFGALIVGIFALLGKR